MKLSGANRSPAVTGETEMGVKTNYFIGNDPQKWQTDVARYERVRYAEVYPGIDIIYYGQQQSLEYDFEVAPGADAHKIALEFAGVKRVKVERKTGDLILKSTNGEVRQHKPVAYQEVGGERQEVEHGDVHVDELTGGAQLYAEACKERLHVHADDAEHHELEQQHGGGSSDELFRHAVVEVLEEVDLFHLQLSDEALAGKLLDQLAHLQRQKCTRQLWDREPTLFGQRVNVRSLVGRKQLPDGSLLRC